MSLATAVTIVVASLCGINLPARALEETNPPAAKKAVLSPEAESKFKEFLDKTKTDETKAWDERIKKKLDEVTKVTGVGDEAKKNLEPAARQAAATWITEWSVKLEEVLRKELTQNPEMAATRLAQMVQFISVSQMDWNWPVEMPPPFEQETWTKALQQTLTPDQLATWNKAEADRKEAIEKEISEPLKQRAVGIHEQQMQAISSEYKEIELALGLPKDRADKLEALAKSVVDQTTEMWRKRTEGTLFAMDDEQRHQFVAGRIFMGPSEKESPSQQATWKDGVAAFLTAEETKRLQTSREEHKVKRAHVLGEVMIMLLDDKIAFTANQRQQLQPVAFRLVKDVPEFYPGSGMGTYFSYTPPTFYAAATKINDGELRPILDEKQRKHWRQLSEPGNQTKGDDEDEEDGVTPPEDKKTKPVVYTEPEDVEKCISLFLYDKTQIEQKRVLAANVIKAEDVVRTAGLGSDSAARLLIAARGATEEYLTNWKWNVDQQIRSQLQEATPKNIQQRLNGMEEYFFQRNMDMSNRQGSWDKTVQATLSPAQLDLWRKETDARKVYHDQAIADLILAEFDRKNQLSEDQWKKLGPLVATSLHDYSQDIGRIFAFSNNVPWYLESSYLLMPLAGVPDADLKAILTPDQWDRWTKSNEYSNASNMWQNVQQFHKQRIHN